MGYQQLDETNGNYRVVSSSIAGDLDLINTIEAEGWKLLFTGLNGIDTYYYFTKQPIMPTLTSEDRGKIDEIVEALYYLETEHLINYSEEIDFLYKIREW